MRASTATETCSPVGTPGPVKITESGSTAAVQPAMSVAAPVKLTPSPAATSTPVVTDAGEQLWFQVRVTVVVPSPFGRAESTATCAAAAGATAMSVARASSTTALP